MLGFTNPCFSFFRACILIRTQKLITSLWLLKQEQFLPGNYFCPWTVKLLMACSRLYVCLTCFQCVHPADFSGHQTDVSFIFPQPIQIWSLNIIHALEAQNSLHPHVRSPEILLSFTSEWIWVCIFLQFSLFFYGFTPCKALVNGIVCNVAQLKWA